MANVMALPATGDELDLEDLLVARFEDEEDEEWTGEGEEGWDDEDDLDDDEWDEDDDEWDEDDEDWGDDEGWDDEAEEET